MQDEKIVGIKQYHVAEVFFSLCPSDPPRYPDLVHEVPLVVVFRVRYGI